jgi:predicted transcriptional regulator
MTVQIALRISDELATAVDQLCDREPGSPTRSEVLRRAIEDYVDRKRRAADDAAIVAAYTLTPQSTPDEWGSPAEGQRQSSALVAARLDAEDGGW